MSDEFWQRVRPDGTRGGPYQTNLFGRRVSTKQPTIGLARTWKAGKLLEGANPRLAASKKARLDDAVRDLLAELRRRGRRPKTIEKNRKKMATFLGMWGVECRLSTIDARKVNAYIDSRLLDDGAAKDTSLSRTTIRDELAALRQTLKLAKRHGLYAYALEDVLPDRFEANITPRKDFVPWDKLWRLYGQLPEHRRAHVLWFCVTGGRCADSFRARREDFDVSSTEWRITVRGSKTKGSYRTIPVPEFCRWTVALILREAPGEELLFQPWSEGSMNRDIKAACRRAGLGPVSTNGLRRTFGHGLLGHGYSMDVISKMFGHSTEKLAREVYANMNAEELAEKVRKQGAA